MDGSPQATESLFAVATKSDIASTGLVPSGLVPSDDQCFLLYFIMGIYFGPDLKGESPQKSVLQRLAEGLPPYTSEQLTGSHMKTLEVERIYHYVLRKADQSLIVKLPWLNQFFHGNLPTLAQDSSFAYPQFPDLFPPALHPHSMFKNRYKIIQNIVFINNPEIFYIKPENVEKFKRLTGLEDFLLDRDGAMLHNLVKGDMLYDVAIQEVESNGEMPNPMPGHGPNRTDHINDIPEPKDGLQDVHAVKPISGLHCNGLPMTCSYMAPLPTEVDTTLVERLEPRMIFLPSQPTMEEWEDILSATKSGSALTGSAAMGQIGPVIGLIDIGESEDSYLFRVSLPGVKRDEREFCCEVENDGKVLIRGVTTTGEKTVCRYSQMFEMQSQNLCPPGHFSISFRLPGPVDPQNFSGNFGTDGILEGIVMKGQQ
ncbi:uncharacterized protein LOC132299728 isoform X2 [Cornus florida]|nr:uncharacterized protein LOC132299728 isoform X2 [Cornus florida]